ncbi:CPBP family intramembrane glutamic endopeptidase [Marinirhabdus gelatinilytica]|uniref:CAAX prenyl protease-like protein n=1 Tax=Marinirhabdus gelatinilytica TaxID=1703343 RepID=A0A370QFD8_9FLAO|nr:CPBP family intramembrane glutamic endopeptidase [Marinirhabdus gelatinilytica]RDK86999.1 CAAX prenyl protease-like protein [Marinirhabdus gelatinilytica]
MKTRLGLLLEFFTLFILLPVSLAVPFLIWIKVGMVVVGFFYILFRLKKSENINFRIRKGLDWKSFWRRLVVTFLLVVLITTAYVWFQDKTALFFVPKNNPGLFVIILFVYTFLSVWPQEIIYRTFFFERYGVLFQNRTFFIFINAIVFSLAHLFFRNTLVLLLTFIGGVLFGYTYLKYRSTTLVSIEHALYGNWLFAVGMGQMLAFPGMEG